MFKVFEYVLLSYCCCYHYWLFNNDKLDKFIIADKYAIWYRIEIKIKKKISATWYDFKPCKRLVDSFEGCPRTEK